MRDEIKEIAHTLRGHNTPAKQKYEQLTSVLTDSLSPAHFIRDLESEMKKADCLYCDEQPFCRFYITFAYKKQKHHQRAKEYLEDAINGFRVRGATWNEAMAHWLLGEILVDEKDFSLAQRSFERAKFTLDQLIKELRAKSKYDDAKTASEYVSKIEAAIGRAKSPAPLKPLAVPALSLPVNTTAIPVYSSKISGDEGYLIISSIGVYDEVEAGPNGPIWSERLEISKTEVHRVYLRDKDYQIYSTKYGDRRIVLLADRKYAWAKIHGHSMDAAQPVPIREEDYVLFYQADKPEKDGIVIAAKYDNSDGSQYMVKRYVLDDNLLISETTKNNNIYAPIEMTSEFKIIGVVVAIAKPV